MFYSSTLIGGTTKHKQSLAHLVPFRVKIVLLNFRYPLLTYYHARNTIIHSESNASGNDGFGVFLALYTYKRLTLEYQYGEWIARRKAIDIGQVSCRLHFYCQRHLERFLHVLNEEHERST